MATAEPAAKKARCTPLAPRPALAGAAPAVYHATMQQAPPPAAAVSGPPKAPLLLPGPAPGDAAAPKVEAPVAPSKKRQFSKSDEETLVALWRDNIEAYYKGVRRRVLEKMTAKMNENLATAPFFSLKQVENKLSYMEKRYKSVLDEMRKLGFSCGADEPSSVRISCERKFCLFYDVHDILGNIVGNDAYTKRGAAVVPAQPPPVGVAAAAPTPAPEDATPPAPLVDDVHREEDGDLAMLPTLDDAESGGGAADTAGGSSSSKRVRADEPIASRVMKVTERMVRMGERLMVADREERRDRLEMARLDADVRSRELQVRVRTAEAAARRDKIEALKFVVEQLAQTDDQDGHARVLRQLEEVVNEN